MNVSHAYSGHANTLSASSSQSSIAAGKSCAPSVMGCMNEVYCIYIHMLLLYYLDHFAAVV